MRMEKACWYKDYIRTTDDTSFILHHFLKDFLFQHRLRYMIYFRIAQKTGNKLLKLFMEFKLLRLGKKYGIEVKPSTKIGAGFVMTHPYNITISPRAILGKNINIMKGATIGHSGGKKPGAPHLGDCVFVGLNATLLGGIHIGDDVMIAPNTFVNQDIPSHSIVIGNPCKIIPKENATGEYIYYRV